MHSSYLKSRNLWRVDVSSLVRRSGDYFNRLGNDVQTNVNEFIQSVPKERRAFASQDCVQSFVLNDSGWPMSDVTLLLKAQNDDQISMVLNRLVELKRSSNIPEGTSDHQIIQDYIVPRYVGTSSEYLTYLTGKYETSITSDDMRIMDDSDAGLGSVSSDGDLATK